VFILVKLYEPTWTTPHLALLGMAKECLGRLVYFSRAHNRSHAAVLPLMILYSAKQLPIITVSYMEFIALVKILQFPL
jgi:hypothetical protein